MFKSDNVILITLSSEPRCNLSESKVHKQQRIILSIFLNRNLLTATDADMFSFTIFESITTPESF